MLRQLHKHRMLKIFNTLGLWSIPALSIPLLLPLVLAQSISRPLQANDSILESVNANLLSVWTGQSLLSQRLAALRGQLPSTFQATAALTEKKQAGQKQTGQKQTGQTQAQAKSSPITQKAQANQKAQQPRQATTVARSNPVVQRAIVQEPPAIELQVKVAENAMVPVSTSTNGVILDDSGRVLRAIPAMQPIYAQAGSQGVELNDWQAPTSVWLQPSDGGYVFVGEHWYRGRVRLILKDQKVLAVNHVDLEDYLPGVVGSEMYHDWSLEALKAQAVAARSYALVYYIRPASTYYQIGSDEYYQVYKGLTSEGNSPREAVRQTMGQVLSFKGGVVESLYASSDELVAEVHKGFGMSQQGAQKLAAQGYNYLQILGSYYPGTTLAQLKPYQQ